MNYVLCLGDLRAKDPTEPIPILRGDYRHEIEDYLRTNLVAPWSHGDYVKCFRRGTPLEWCTAPASEETMTIIFPENEQELLEWKEQVLAEAKNDPEYKPEDEEELRKVIWMTYDLQYQAIQALPQVKDLPKTILVSGIVIEEPNARS